MMLPPAVSQVLELRGEEPAEASPPRVDLVFVSRGLHGLGAGTEHLHRYLAWEGAPGVICQVEGPVLDRELAVVRAGDELRLAELELQVRRLKRAVARRPHGGVDREVQVEPLTEASDGDIG